MTRWVPLKSGKKPTLVLLDRNLFEIDATEIPKAKVLATMFDGRVVHDVTLGHGDPTTVDMSYLDDFNVDVVKMHRGE